MSKIMDTAEKEVIRREILELCRETQPYGAGRPALKAALRKSSYDVSDKELLTHVARVLSEQRKSQISVLGSIE